MVSSLLLIELISDSSSSSAADSGDGERGEDKDRTEDSPELTPPSNCDFSLVDQCNMLLAAPISSCSQPTLACPLAPPPLALFDMGEVSMLPPRSKRLWGQLLLSVVVVVVLREAVT